MVFGGKAGTDGEAVTCNRSSFKRWPVAAAMVGIAAIGIGGCAQQPQQLARSKEYFPSSTWGPASPRVVADGEPVPRGGGSYLVGKPYSVNGRTYYPSEKKYAAVGLASWYGDAFHGRRTSNGEVYDRDGISAASPTMPLPSYARVTNLRNNYSMIVRVNDRGPFVGGGRIMDVSRQVAQTLDFHRAGTTKVKVEYIAPASLAGSDDRKLLATLRQDGPAMMPGEAAPVMVAQQAPPARVASAEPVPQPPLRRSINETQVAPTRVADAGDDMVEKHGPASAAPLPPSRPFDLGTIPGAGVPIGHLRQALAR